jgi:hypothetical protein
MKPKIVENLQNSKGEPLSTVTDFGEGSRDSIYCINPK